MADVTGPINTLPGTHREPPQGTECDHHPDRPAVTRVQGETDSMGCEMYDLCEECYVEFREGQKEARLGQCDWCKQEATDLRAKRDWEEGATGPVYHVCGACVKRRNDEDREQMSDDYNYDYEADEDEYEAFDCHMDRSGHCGAAGSEDCEFECPYRRDQYRRQREAEARRRSKGGKQGDMLDSPPQRKGDGNG